jgi:hypothetical protein
MPTYTVKNVKTFRGTDGDGYNATVYCDGKKIALAMDGADGGPLNVEWEDFGKGEYVDVNWKDHKDEDFVIHCTPFEAQMYEHVRGKTWQLGEYSGNMDPDLFIEELVNDFLNEKNRIAQEKRWIKKETLFRLKDDKAGSFRTIGALFSKRVKDFIINKYGEQVEYILNERYGQIAV